MTFYIDKFEIKPKSALKIYYGSYVVSRLADDPKKREAQLKRKKLTSADEFYLKSLPGHVQLALRMRARGQTIESGSRISMVYTRRNGYDAPAYEKLEELEYFETFYHKRYIDTTHYVQLFLTPIQEIFEAYFSEDMNLYFKTMNKTIQLRARLLEQLNGLFCPLQFIQ